MGMFSSFELDINVAYTDGNSQRTCIWERFSYTVLISKQRLPIKQATSERIPKLYSAFWVARMEKLRRSEQQSHI
jgi:hypothetical protein